MPILLLSLGIAVPILLLSLGIAVPIFVADDRDERLDSSIRLDPGLVETVLVEAGADRDWRQHVTAQLLHQEYFATSGSEGLQAPNRAHDLRTYFGATGIEVVPRSDKALSWCFAWETARFGRPGMLQAVAAARPEPDESRVTYRHLEFDEWYTNSPDGLEQGFIVHASPPGAGPLCLIGRLAGSIRAELCPEEGAVDLFDENSVQVLRYGELHVWDAAGNEIPSRLSLSGAELAILVEDEDAAYPLIIDPLLTVPAWNVFGNQDGAQFGISVATAGDVNGDGFSDVIVGADHYDNGFSDQGRAFVYHGSANGLAQSPMWTAEVDQFSAEFGYAVATAGDVNGDGFSDVIVGAPLCGNGQLDEGVAFVYHGSAGGLAATAASIVQSNQASARFGASVAPAGDVNGDGFSDVIVGAPLYDNGEADEGRAFVYHGSVNGLPAFANWTAESNQANAQFAYSVSTAGDVNGDGFSDVIIGAWLYDFFQDDEGRASIYHGSTTGLGSNADWTAETNQDDTRFGNSVGTAGDVNGDGFSDVIVGAYLYSAGENGEGRAFVYHGSATGTATAAAWTGENDQAGAEFGISVATAGDVNGDGFADVIVGARRWDDEDDVVHPDAGRAYVYHGSATGLATTPDWSPLFFPQDDARFGASVATAGDVNGDGFSDVIVGAHQYDDDHTDEGRASVFHGSAAGLGATSSWTAESDQAATGYGVSLATAGDVNGDGFADVIVGAPRYDNGQADEGRAFVYHGSAAGLGISASWTAEGNQAGANFGSSVATAGDVNGDGFSDVIVGVPQYDNGESEEGRARVYHGSTGGLSPIPAWGAESQQAGANFGSSVSTAGDVNGDGFADVIVGAPLYDNGQADEGRAFGYHGSAAGLGTSTSWTAEGNQAGANCGSSVATAGDVNGDGFSDVIVGVPQYDNGESNEGRALVYHGSTGGLSPIEAWGAESQQAGANFGSSVAPAGDVNGDGFSDVIIGSFLYDNGQTDEGRAFVYHGSASGLAPTAAWTAESNQAGANFGIFVAGAGDVNGDGFSDVLVGADLYDGGQTDEGRAYAYHGSGAGLAPSPAWTAESDQIDAGFGLALAMAGDVNGDGFSEAIVGAYQYDNGQSDEGRAFLYYGNDGPGRRTLPRQRRTDSLTPIALLGRSDSETQFRIRAILLSIYGRTRLQMEIEVKPRGVPFDGLNTAFDSFSDTGSDGAIEFNRLVADLTPDTQYHWRVRAKYDLPKTPFQRNGPWVHIPANGWNEADLRTAGSVSSAPGNEAIESHALFQLSTAGANPGLGQCEVRLALGQSARIHAEVIDVSGRQVTALVEDENYEPGSYILKWDGRDRYGAKAAAGVYFIHVRSHDEVRVQKTVLVR